MSSYATVQELRDYLKQVEQSTETTSPMLVTILARATSIIRTAIRNELRDRIFDFDSDTPAAITRSINAGYSVYLALPPHTIGSITSVIKTSSAAAVVGYTEQTTSPHYGALRLTGDAWAITAPSLWAGWYTVTAAWGYGVVPANINELCLEIAVDIWRKKDAGFFAEIGTAGEGALPVVVEWDRLGVISAFVEQYRRVSRYE